MQDGQRERDVFADVVIEGIDLRKGEQCFPGGVYMDVLRTWCRHVMTNIGRLNDLLRELPDAEALNRYIIAAHGLKGSCHGICAEGIGKAAEALEAAGRSGDMAFIEASHGPFVGEVVRLHGKLAEFLDGLASHTGAKPTAVSPDISLLARFLDACRLYKSGTMEEILKKLEAFEYESGGDLVSWLREQMDELEYDAIQKRLVTELKG